ncbi:MAG: GNAT family N-acetyltransferase [Alphaproteobacteria bacterium]
MATTQIRPATPDDAATVVRLIKALAVYENEPESVVEMTEANFRAHGFGERPYFECLLAELDGEAVGFALYFHNYSTWTGKPGIYLEDLFVDERARGHGLGRALVEELARIAQARDCGRLDLSVLHWNQTRDFYHRIGMKHMADWLPYRLDRAGMATLAANREGKTT